METRGDLAYRLILNLKAFNKLKNLCVYRENAGDLEGQISSIGSPSGLHQVHGPSFSKNVHKKYGDQG